MRDLSNVELLDLFTAELLRDRGMQRSLDFTERDQPGWSDVARQLLERYARTHREFTSEQCTAAAAEYGLRTVQPKAWGSVFVLAAKDGVIRKVGYGISNRRHRSPTPMWQSQIYGGTA